MPDIERRMLVGLGNPGPRYAATRHNIGFRVADAVAERHGISLDRRRFDTVYGIGSLGGIGLVVAQPQAYMNLSGPPVRALAEYFGISTGAIAVAHDDIDLNLGRLKIKEKGGHGGHRGLRSLIDAFGSGDFCRLRFGVGRPEVGGDVAEYVLQEFGREEDAALDEIVSRGRKAFAVLLTHGILEAMNRFNDRSQSVSR